jgi:3-phenylpropionate/trans-cinnamate dioxygenase ferredoxin reductase subunit
MEATVVDVVIVGGGQAGAQVAISLRKGGFRGPISLIGDEPQLPYTRPMLSKEFLLDSTPPNDLYLRDQNFWTDLGVEIQIGTSVGSVDPDRRFVTLADGTMIQYVYLVLATGGAARALPVLGRDLEGVGCLRSLADAAALKAQASLAKNAVVVGGGYLGLETAAALTHLGLRVTVVEAMSALLGRVTSPVVSSYFLDLHRSSGVSVITGGAVQAFLGGCRRLQGVRLNDGRVLACDIAAVAVGMSPNDELLRQAGADCDDGVLVDQRCRTSLTNVYAVGDCARRLSEYSSARELVRLECVQNAIAQAKLAARDILGLPFEPPGAPWFWSNQFGTKLKSVGLFQGYDDLMVEGDPATGSFAVSYLESGVTIARDCVNNLSGYGKLKKNLEQRVTTTIGAGTSTAEGS